LAIENLGENKAKLAIIQAAAEKRSETVTVHWRGRAIFILDQVWNFMVKDCLLAKWPIGTIQVDYQTFRSDLPWNISGCEQFQKAPDQ